MENTTEVSDCPVCLEKIQDESITPCNHKFCKECLTEWNRTHRTCPMCRQPLPRVFYIPSVDEMLMMFGQTEFVMVGGLEGYQISLILDGQPNWIPQQWWDDVQDRDFEYTAILELMDRGVTGHLHLENSLIINLNGIWMCDFCDETPYISNRFDDVDTHEQDEHPLLYDPVQAALNRASILNYDVPF